MGEREAYQTVPASDSKIGGNMYAVVCGTKTFKSYKSCDVPVRTTLAIH